MTDPVAITSTGVVTSIGSGPEELWDAVISGKSGVRSIEGFDGSGFRCAAAQTYDPGAEKSGIDPRDARIMQTHSYLLTRTMRSAFAAACLPSPSVLPETIGFFAGMGMVDYQIADLLPAVLKSLDHDRGIDYDLFFSEGYKEIHPLWPLSMLNNISFCQVAIGLDIQGDNTVLSPHADSGARSVHEAMLSVRERRSRIAFASGVSETVGPISIARAKLSGMLASGETFDEQLPRPFDAERHGTALGEGCGVIGLELLSHALARGARPRALLSGVGSACERQDSPAGTSASAIAGAMQQALDSSGRAPREIDAVIAHGDGTRDGDGQEIEAINQVFSAREDRVPVFSSKGALGHLLAAAPVVDLIVALSMLEHGTVPATLHTRRVDDDARFTVVTGQPLRTQLQRIMVNCRSSEGQAVSLVIEACPR